MSEAYNRRRTESCEWVILFEDADMKPEVFTDETAARERYQSLVMNWDCNLFVSSKRIAELEADIERRKVVQVQLAEQVYTCQDENEKLSEREAELEVKLAFSQSEHSFEKRRAEDLFNTNSTLKLRVAELEADARRLREMLLNQPWHTKARIIKDYMPPYPSKYTKPSVVIEFDDGSEYKPMLRYSHGPRQGFFWDLYGDDFQDEALALIALSQAPTPLSVGPIRFSLKMNDAAMREAAPEGEGK